MDTIDIYCVFTKLKLVDDYEAISVNYLEYELKNLENGNDISDGNITHNDINNNFRNSQKFEERKNESIFNEKKVKENDTKKNKGEIKLIESDSDEESFDNLDDSDSKIDSEPNDKNNTSKFN